MTIDVIRLASEADIDLELHVGIGREPVWIATQDELERFTALAMEECAKVCENLPMQQSIDVRDQAAAAIRARKPA